VKAEVNVAEFKKILCPMDFFPASERAFDYALSLASKYGASVHVLHVISRIVPTVSDKPVRTSPKTREEETQAKRELKRLQDKAAKASVPIETEIRIGDIDVQIIDTIKDVGADLQILGTHGRRGLELWIMGSVAERMMRHSPVPLIVLGAKAAAPPRRVLVTTDFSKGTPDAIAHAVSIGEKFAAKVTILHVIEAEPPLKLKADINRQLAGLVPTGDTRLETGTPYSTILDVIKEMKPGLVVMNTHGQGMVERVLIGSTVERVVRGVGGSCPVLLVPPMKKRKGR
jgi:nucleotide-binding universal stress UspA family protein